LLYPAELREQNLYFINAIQQPNVGLCQWFLTVAKRLKESQKLEILEGYRLGKSSIVLASEYGCTPNTVVRTVKSMLPAQEYKSLKKSRGKEHDLKINASEKSKSENSSPEEFNQPIPIYEEVKDQTVLEKLALEDAGHISDEVHDMEGISKENNQSSIFKELVPLVSDFGFEERQQKVPLKELSPGVLPEIIYMLVDKKVELESKSLNDFPEWSFLPESEKDRQVISLFANQRAAKRSCSRGQRVIKVPDSNVFIISKSFLLSKGITRLVLDDSLIAID
tara:strand:- start:2250 stop:3089 length:840 start_codon:yes stop_codon:yes gene_type:complete